MKYRYLDMNAGLNVVINGRPYSFPRGHERFEEIAAAVRRGRPPEVILEIVNRDAEHVQRLVRHRLSENLVLDDGVLYYQGCAFENDAVSHLISLLNAGHDTRAVVNFIEKLKRNPLASIVEELFRFLEFGKIPLTPDGDFLAYKAVRADYKDIHSGTFLNAIGARPSVPRSFVDPDRDRTCSRGLHVCSYAYLPHFANANGHVMMCKVSPEDVVAIPTDYNNTKMRTCSYEVVEEVTKYYQEGTDVLGSGPKLMEEKYEVWYGGSGLGDIFDTFYTPEEAQRQADALKAGGTLLPGEDEVWVEHADGTERLYTAR